MVLGFYCCLPASAAMSAASSEEQKRETVQLRSVAEASLRRNIHKLTSGEYISAGAHQFKALWTRDFAYRIRSLVLLGKADLVRRQIELTLRHRRASDGVLPKGLDNFPRDHRSTYFSLKRLLPFLSSKLKLAEPLKPVFEDLNDSLAIDSNLLIVHAALDYLETTNDRVWWDRVEDQLVPVFKYYEKFLVDGLIKQQPYSDWQDTVSRPGFVFLTNLLYYHTCERLVAHPKFGVSADQVRSLKNKLQATFRPSPTRPFSGFADVSYINTDGNLLALDFGFYAEDHQQALGLYQALKNHPLWKQPGGIPGRVSYPVYPDSWKPTYIKFVGLKPYHDELFWSWLMGLSAKVAYQIGDVAEGNRIFSVLARLSKRDRWIYEVYENRRGLPLFKDVLVDSEGPFTWGASFVLDMIDYACTKKLRSC
jgi:hypothetical protein